MSGQREVSASRTVQRSDSSERTSEVRHHSRRGRRPGGLSDECLPLGTEPTAPVPARTAAAAPPTDGDAPIAPPVPAEAPQPSHVRAAGEHSCAPLPVKEREACVGAIGPDSTGWERVAAPPPPSGYVCAFYSLGGAMICGGEVRLLGRWRQRQRGLLPTTAALHFAPTRVPQRPLPDATGVRVIESDGSVLLLLELDDYLATIESTVGGEEPLTHPLVGAGVGSDGVPWALLQTDAGHPALDLYSSRGTHWEKGPASIRDES